MYFFQDLLLAHTLKCTGCTTRMYSANPHNLFGVQRPASDFDHFRPVQPRSGHGNFFHPIRLQIDFLPSLIKFLNSRTFEK